MSVWQNTSLITNSAGKVNYSFYQLLYYSKITVIAKLLFFPGAHSMLEETLSINLSIEASWFVRKVSNSFSN